MSPRLPLLLALATVACGSEHTLITHTQTDVWLQPDVSSVDILFVVDDSNSMAEEQAALADGFRQFIDLLDEAAADFRLGVVTTNEDDRGQLIGDPPWLTPSDDYVRSFQDRVRVGTGGSDKEKGLQVAAEALTGANPGFVRTEAMLLTVFVSDEDDCSDFGALDGHPSTDCYRQADALASTARLLGQMRGVKDDARDFVAAGILGLHASTCDDAWPGGRYLDVVRATGGLTGDICSADWSDMLFELGLNTVGEQYRFPLSLPARASSLRVTVDGEPAEDWTYDEAAWMVVFDEGAVPPRGAEIRADYTVLPSTTE